MADINVKGPIISNDQKWIYDWFSMDATCSNDISKAIKNLSKGEELNVLINSPGGYVDEGSEIYTLLKDYNGPVNIKIAGMAASAASVIAMAGDKVMISPTARLMIHNASGGIYGDCNAMTHGAAVLQDCNEAIANAYELKTGMARDKILNLMNEETFMNAKRAKELGFVDEIMFDPSNKLTNALESGMLPNDVINKMRNMNLNDPEANQVSKPVIEKITDDNNTTENNEPIIVASSNDNNLDEKKEILRKRLELKNKCASSLLFCQNERMI